MLELIDLSIWLPRRGHVLTDISLDIPQGVTVLVGRTGSATSVLLRALASRLPAGARFKGKARYGARDLLADLPDDLPEVGYVPGSRISSAPATELLLVDGDHPDRELLIRQITDRAALGQQILWATHELDVAWQVADTLVEFSATQALPISSWPDWELKTLPEPMLQTLSRLLELPPQNCRTPRTAAAAFAESGIKLPVLPTRNHKPLPSARACEVSAEELGLTGEALHIRQGQCIGLIALDDMDFRLRIPNLVRLSEPDHRQTMSQVSRRWERQFGLADATLLATAAASAPLRPKDLVGKHSSGERALLKCALFQLAPRPMVATEPQLGLDPRAKHSLAEKLLVGSPANRFLVSQDIEFLVRSCHQIVVARDSKVVTIGSPTSVLSQLDSPPLVSQVTGSQQYLRLSDVVAAIYEQEQS